ncbi:hypothetical protein CEXT_795971 [Caerostris extrusa]|uniref:Uncharacterized protein n=1 Tax=Caerostris extrusa TaxID=172846 RepID=A0AAV4S347_CAEEX|nr:hypothetical protein CEXT_795971 [Caerostris extrusa]
MKVGLQVRLHAANKLLFRIQFNGIRTTHKHVHTQYFGPEAYGNQAAPDGKGAFDAFYRKHKRGSGDAPDVLDCFRSSLAINFPSFCFQEP